MINKNKGITLIALVVTIIVLLILAGVAIVTLTGENGIVNRTTEARRNSKISEVEEEARLIYTDYLIGNKAEATALADLETIYNYDKRNFTMKRDTQGTETINGIKTNLEPDLTSTEPLTDTFTFEKNDTSTQIITISKDSIPANGTKYYAVVDGKDYEMKLENGNVNVSRVSTDGALNNGAILTNVTATVSPIGVVDVNVNGNNVEISRNSEATNGSATITITGRINNTTYTKIAKVSIQSYISEEDPFVGKYADINNDGEIDGIIYADLAVGNTNHDADDGIKGKALGVEYSIPQETGLKKYESAITNESTPREYLRVANNEGKDRFYVVALNNAGNSTMTWYGNASGYMDTNDTQKNFGDGKTNTKTIIQRATEATTTTGYRLLSNTDIWYLFTGDLSNWTDNMKSWWSQYGYEAVKNHPEGDGDGHSWSTLLKEGWFVPSNRDWAAVKGELSDSELSAVGLSSFSWSSSQTSADSAWLARFYDGDFSYGNVANGTSVRLGTTF